MKAKGKKMTTKPTQPKPALPTSLKGKAPKTQDVLHNKEKFLTIDQKMQRLRKQREKLHLNQALFFTKEVQKVLGEEGSLEVALVVLEKTWRTSSKSQKEEWQKHIPSFRASCPPPHEQKSLSHDSVSE